MKGAGQRVFLLQREGGGGKCEGSILFEIFKIMYIIFNVFCFVKWLCFQLVEHGLESCLYFERGSYCLRRFAKKAGFLLLAVGLLWPLGAAGEASAAAPQGKTEQINNVLDRLVTVQTVGDYDTTAARDMVYRVWNIHPSILVAMDKADVEVKFINFPLTDLPEYAYLKGVVPRGWEHTGYTWDDEPGVGGKTVVARIGYSDSGNMHSSLNLELHETAHAIDYYVFGRISYSESFRAIQSEERLSFSTNPYYSYPEEYFAETFAYYHRGEESREHLKAVAPRTYEFMDKLYRNIPNHGRETAKERSVKVHGFRVAHFAS